MGRARFMLPIFIIVLRFGVDAYENIQDCQNEKKVPYRAIVHEDGRLELSCRYVDCVNASKETPQCETKFHGHSCNEFPQWLHAVRQSNAGKKSGPVSPIQTKCCKFQRLLNGRYLGTTTLKRKQGFLGGFSYIRGQENSPKRDGFDVITNMTKEGQGYRIWVYRMRCIPPPPKQQPKQQNPNDYFDTKPRGHDPNINYQNVDVRDKNGNAQTVPVVYSSGCFDSKTQVHSEHRGQISMDQLRVGENVLTIHGKTASYRPVSFFLHRDPNFTARYLTLNTDKPGISITMTPFHITYSDRCEKDPSKGAYPQKFANQVREGDCLMYLDRESGRLETARVTNISESYRKGIYSPITPNGVIITNDLVSSCYSFIKNQDLQASIFYYMMRLEKTIQYYFSLPTGWLLGGHQSKVDVPRGLDYILTALDYILPVSKII